MRFLETPVFTSRLRGLVDEDQYRAVQLALLLRPEQGPLIPSSGGLRKLRWGVTGRGKRGGLRLIYYWAPQEQAFYLLYVYAKNEQGDLTPAQVKTLRGIVREEFP